MSGKEVINLRSSKFEMVFNRPLDSDNSGSSDEEEEEEFRESRRELRAGTREDSGRRLRRSVSADMVLLRAANPHCNQFLYVEAGARGELGLRMGFVDPFVKGQGVFQRRMRLEDSVMEMVYSYTNLHFNRAIAVREGGASPSVSLMEPPKSPVTSLDPRLFMKMREPYGSFRLQSLPLKNFSLTYTDTGEVSLTKQGSRFKEREGNAVDEVDGGHKQSLDLDSARMQGLCPPPQPPVVAEYVHPYPTRHPYQDGVALPMRWEEMCWPSSAHQ